MISCPPKTYCSPTALSKTRPRHNLNLCVLFTTAPSSHLHSTRLVPFPRFLSQFFCRTSRMKQALQYTLPSLTRWAGRSMMLSSMAPSVTRGPALSYRPHNTVFQYLRTGKTLMRGSSLRRWARILCGSVRHGRLRGIGWVMEARHMLVYTRSERPTQAMTAYRSVLRMGLSVIRTILKLSCVYLAFFSDCLVRLTVRCALSLALFRVPPLLSPR